MRHLFLFLLLFLPVTVFGAAESCMDTAKRLQDKYDSLDSLAFHFNQKTKDALGGRPRRGSGEAFFLRTGNPGKMRWNYAEPEQQVLISDGVTLSMYFANMKQMIISPVEAMKSDLTYSFFTGRGKLTEDFSIYPPDEKHQPVPEEKNSTSVIKLIPNDIGSQVKQIHLWISPDSFIQRLEIVDHFDTITTLTLSNIELNTLAGLDGKRLKSLFTFTPPAGTEIIEQ